MLESLRFIVKVASVLCFVVLFTGCASLYGSDPRQRLYTCDPWKGEQLVKLPGWDDAWQTVKSCSTAPPEKVSIAMKVFYLYWLETFGDRYNRVSVSMNKLMVLWGEEPRTVSGYRTDGSYGTNLSVQGMAHTKSIVWIKKDRDSRICDTSLVHELVHIAIWAGKGTDGDPDHLGSRYLGWTVNHSALVQKVNEELCRLKI